MCNPHPYYPQDEGEIPSDTEAQIFDTLLRIRRKDPAIYQKDVAFFNRDQEEGEGEEGEGVKTKPKKEKPMYLKDLIAKQVGMVAGGKRGVGTRATLGAPAVAFHTR